MTTSITTREPLHLTAENVESVFNRCITSDTEPDIVNGVQINVRFNPDALATHRDDIISMLNELPDNFHVGSGDGWTFLNMCIDNTGAQWTDFHETCDKLLCLGIGIGAAQFTIKQRDLWRMFPGEMPYITINTMKRKTK